MLLHVKKKIKDDDDYSSYYKDVGTQKSFCSPFLFTRRSSAKNNNNKSFLLRHVSNTTSWYNLLILMSDDGLGRVH